MKTNREKVSYCIGLETGKNIRNQFKDLDLKLLLQGFQDAVDDKPAQLTKDEVSTILRALQEQIQAQERAYITEVSETNKEAGEKFLSDNKQKQGIVTLSSGLQYKVISTGDKNSQSPTMLDVVTCHYRGSFIDGKVFDSSYERGQPITIPISRVIPGWAEALKLMKVGDKWQLFVPHYLAYGEAGYGPIQPNSTLVFEMELLGINQNSEVE